MEPAGMKNHQPMSPEPKRRPAIIVATSQVVRGGVGGRAAVFALERLGFRVWFLPTVQLPWHPGHGAATRITPERETISTHSSTT